MGSKIYDKLVRDKIPEVIRRDGGVPYTHFATGSELEASLWNKLDEEVAEFQESRDVRELADVLEVVYALADFYGVKPEELEKRRQEKFSERGGFYLGIILERVE